MPATKRVFLNKSLTALGAVAVVSAAVVAGNPAVADVTRHPAAVSSTNNAWWTNRIWGDAMPRSSTPNFSSTKAPRTAANTRSRNNAWWTNRIWGAAMPRSFTPNFSSTKAPRTAANTRSIDNAWWTNRLWGAANPRSLK